MSFKQIKQTKKCDCGKKPMVLKAFKGRRVVCLNSDCDADNKRASLSYEKNLPTAIRRWNAIH